MAAGNIAEHFAISRPAVSQHLKVLSDAGLLAERTEGTRRLYRARPDGLLELRAFLEEYWHDSLGRLKSAVESELTTTNRK